MRSKKPFSNTTFTKRVDHEAGRHRPKRAEEEPAVCEICESVYFKKRWTNPLTVRGAEKSKSWRPSRVTICPACKQEREGLPAGFVYLEGAFVAAHRSDLEQLLKNEAQRAGEDNAMGRIMSWTQGEDGKLTVATTTEHLAQRLGHALEKAYAGEVTYDFSHENKLARVTWRRD